MRASDLLAVLLLQDVSRAQHRLIVIGQPAPSCLAGTTVYPPQNMIVVAHLATTKPALLRYVECLCVLLNAAAAVLAQVDVVARHVL